MHKYLVLLLPFFGYAEDIVKVSEAMGHLIGKNLDAMGLDFDLDAIVRGLKEESEGKGSPLNEDECIQAIATLQEEKMSEVTEQEFEHADAISNGDQLENHSVSAADTSKCW